MPSAPKQPTATDCNGGLLEIARWIKDKTAGGLIEAKTNEGSGSRQTPLRYEFFPLTEARSKEPRRSTGFNTQRLAEAKAAQEGG